LARTVANDLIDRIHLPQGVIITATGLEGLGFDLTNQQFVDMTKALLAEFQYTAVKGHTLQWAIGDALAAGEKRYGDTYTDALQLTGLSYSTLNVSRWVASRIPKRMRHGPPVTFGHHKLIAKDDFSPAEKEAWLNAAEDNDWTILEMAEAIEDDQMVKAGLDPDEEKAKRALGRAADKVYTLAPPEWPRVLLLYLVKDLWGRLSGIPRYKFLTSLHKLVNDLRSKGE